jgi:hypothetical protein
MPNKGNNIFKRKDGRYEARYVKQRDKDNNIIKYGFVYGKTYNEAKRKRELTINNLNKVTIENNANTNKFNYSIRNWLKNKTNIKDSTYYNYESIIEGRLIPFFKTKKTNTIKYQDIVNFTLYLKNDCLSNKRIKEILLILKQFLKSQNINFNFSYPKQEKRKIITLTNNEVNIIKNDVLNSKDIKNE